MLKGCQEVQAKRLKLYFTLHCRTAICCTFYKFLWNA